MTCAFGVFRHRMRARFRLTPRVAALSSVWGVGHAREVTWLSHPLLVETPVRILALTVQ